MSPTLVNIAIGILIGCALLGAAFNRRSITIVALAAALPDADVLLLVVWDGAINAVFHSIFIPIIGALLLYWDTEIRNESTIHSRWGPYGVRVAWVSLASYGVAGIGFDFFTVEGVALLFPLSDSVYGLSGRLVFSTQEGFIQEYIRLDSDGILPVWHLGTIGTYPIETGVLPQANGDERVIYLVQTGYHLVFVVTAVATLLARAIVASYGEPSNPLFGEGRP